MLFFVLIRILKFFSSHHLCIKLWRIQKYKFCWCKTTTAWVIGLGPKFSCTWPQCVGARAASLMGRQRRLSRPLPLGLIQRLRSQRQRERKMGGGGQRGRNSKSGWEYCRIKVEILRGLCHCRRAKTQLWKVRFWNWGPKTIWHPSYCNCT